MSCFVMAAKISQVPEGRALRVDIEGRKLALFKIDGEFHAFDDFCSGGADFSKAVVSDDGNLLCPHHGWRFDVQEGVCSMVPDAHVTSYPVKVEGDTILVKLGE